MNLRVVFLFSAILATSTASALAKTSDSGELFTSHTWTIAEGTDGAAVPAQPRSARIWRVDFAAVAPLDVGAATTTAAATSAEQRPQAYEYSDAYKMRRKIHFIASFATLPLFVGQYISGDKLYDNQGGEGAKSSHGAFAGGIAALFVVNTVTGVWNLVEARHDPNGRTRRLVHGLLMMAANAGFVATGAMAPDGDEIGSSDRSAHRNVAIASMGIATASYVYMLVTR